MTYDPVYHCYNCRCVLTKQNVLVDGKDIRFGAFGSDKKIYKCWFCALIQLRPQWTPEELDKLYENYNQKRDFENQKKKPEIRKWIKKYIKKDCDIALEVGCGTGDTLTWLRENGYEVCGIDKDPSVCDKEKKIRNWDFYDYPYDKSFIYGFQVLEHVTDPRFFILKALSLLGPGCKFVFELPNTEDPLLTLYKNKKFQEFYWYPFHLFFYTPETIRSTLIPIPIKLTVKRTQRYGIVNHLRWLLKGKPGNWNPYIPLLDDIYKFILIHVLKKSDTMILIGEKNE